MTDSIQHTSSDKLADRTVLLVDDDVDILRIVARVFRKQPYGVLTATSAKEAMETMSTHSVDLIVSDEQMPGMSGTELLAWVATNYPDAIRIMLTGCKRVATAMAAINKGGVYRFFTKPCNPVDLGITILKALEFKNLEDENRELQRIRKLNQEQAELAKTQLEQQARELEVMDQLKIARLKAERASKAKSQFIANMTHEFRTPMNAILGFSRLLMRESLTDEQHEQVRFVHESGCALLDLIENILDFSSVEAGELQLHEEDFEPERVVNSVVEMTRALANNKDIAVRAEIDQAVPRLLYGDAGRLRQVLVNLVGNAAKFTERGTIDIRATVEAQADTTVTLRFEVADTGIGIPENLLHTVFEDFTQGDGSATRKYGGTGLGLAIGKRMVELLGGQIGLESEVGQGSRFWFSAVFQKSRCESPPSTNSSEQILKQRLDAAPNASREDRVDGNASRHPGPESYGWQDLVRAVISSCEASEEHTVGEIENCARILRVWAKEHAMDDLSLDALRVELAARRGDLHKARLATQKLENTVEAAGMLVESS